MTFANISTSLDMSTNKSVRSVKTVKTTTSTIGGMRPSVSAAGGVAMAPGQSVMTANQSVQ